MTSSRCPAGGHPAHNAGGHVGVGRALRFTVLLALVFAAGCHGTRPDTLGVTDSCLAACPPTPNCVSSDASDAGHRIEPFRLAIEPEPGWDALEEAVRASTRMRIVTRTATYLHAEATSLVFRFVDDVEFHLRAEEGIIAVRSASRLGSSDFGVNRRRVERLRVRLEETGAIRLRRRGAAR